MLFSVATYCLANFLLFTFCELATYEPIMDETASFKSVKSGSHFRRTRSFKRELFSTIFNFSRHFCVAMLVNICVYSKRENSKLRCFVLFEISHKSKQRPKRRENSKFDSGII